MELLLLPLAIALIVYIGVCIMRSVKMHQVSNTFNNITCKCTHCEKITPFTDYRLIKIYEMFNDTVIESYFICPHCQTKYFTSSDLPIHSYKDEIISNEWRNRT